jgi:hypothetical protein
MASILFALGLVFHFIHIDLGKLKALFVVGNEDF